MADGQYPTLVSKDQDPNSLTNQIFVQITDGTDGMLVNADGSINVTVTGGASNSQFAEDSAHVSGDIGTEMLAVRRDTPVSGTSADGDYATLNVDANGRLYCIVTGAVSITGSVTVTATDLDIRDLVFATDKVDVSGSAVTAVVTATNLDIRDLVFATDKVDVSGSAVTAVVTATDLDIRNLNLTDDAVKVSANATANSQSNPIYVAVTNPIVTGEVSDYSTATPAGGATSNHDYTVVTAMKLKSIEFSCSGAMKVEVLVGPVASLVSKAVSFIPNAGGGNRITFDPPIEVPTTSTGTVRIVRTNRNNQATDVYSTIIGLDA